MFMTLLSAFTVVLSRYSGQDDVIVGTPIANRNRAEIEGLVGFFVNNLVLRTDLSGDPSFAELLNRVRERTLAAYAHQDLPFEQLVDELAVARDRSRTPLFQTMFSFVADDTSPSVADVSAPQASSSVKYDLRLILGDTGTGLTGAVEYSTALFDDDRMARLVDHLCEVLAAVARDASVPLSRLPMLTGGELDRLAGWNATEAPVWEVGGVHELVEAQPPEGVAVVCGGVELTYGELDERANRLAHHLRDLGVRAEQVVGLCLPRGVEQVVALLAVWKAGGAYLPLDPDNPAERLAYLIGDSGAAVVVADHEIEAGVPVLRLDDPATAARIDARPSTGCGVACDSRQLGYVIYTSGSTGRPKGVLSAHRGLVNRLTWMQDRHALAPGERVLHKTPLTFDVSLWELLWPLTMGGCLVLAEPGRHGDVDYLVGLIEQRRISVTHFVPSLFHQFVEHPWSAPMSRLRLVVCSGEALNAGDVARFYARHATATVEDLYGPTESSIDVSCWSCPRPGGPAAMPIGAPIANVRLYVLDAALNPVPAGVTGELYIGGIGLARGYAGRPELSAERFIADPFTTGSRLYRTGDLARWRADGNIFYLGRADHQVKIRGFRIEPGEIEAILRGHPGVAAAVVVADGRDADRRLVAYLVPADLAAGVPAPGVLREHLRGSLPGYMVPAVFVELSVLPLNSSGKVDRAALPAPDGARPELVGGFVAPRTVTEELLAGIWAQVLGVDRVGVFDDFFDLGGHSLLATQVMSRVRVALQTEVALAALFDRPTVADLAEVIDGTVTGVPAPPIVRVDRDRPLPLSFGQQRLWFLAQLEPDSVEYNAPMVVPWRGPLDVDRLSGALARLIARHEVLRTRLVADESGEPRQMIDPPPSRVPVPVVDVSADADPEAAAERFTAADARVPFDLAAGPQVRASVVRISPEEHLVVLAMHHVVADEWSARIIRDELRSLYRGQPLPELPVQYADFAAWQRQWLSGDVLDSQLAYWRTALADLPVLELPVDRPRPAVRSSDGAVIEFSLPASVADGLRELSRTAGTSMFMTVLAVFTVLLSRYCGQDDVVVGTPIAGRNRAEIEGLVGFFVNTLVLRTDLSGDPTFAEVLARVRQKTLDAYAQQDLPFERLVDELGVERDRSRSPLFQVLFNFFTDDEPEAAGPAATGVEVSAARAAVAHEDLRLVVAESGPALVGVVEYRTALFDEDRMVRLVGHLVELFGEVVMDPDRPISRLEMLPAAERSRVVAEWSQTAAVVPAVGGVHELFEARAACGPDRAAVTYGAESLSYGEVNARANRLARYLRSCGVGAETVVGVCLPRGMDVVVAVLAVWKAGGAYVPLDPEYPAERLGYMLQQSRVELVVSDEDLIDQLPAGRRRMVTIDDPAVAEQPDTDLGVPIASDGLAYVMFTSGSTGRPKGVQVTHGGVVNLVAAQRPVFEVSEGAAVLQFASFGFDAWVSEVGVALASGAELVVASSAERASVAALIRDRGVQVATLPPSLLAVLTPGDLDGLVTLVSAGERLPADLAAAWGARHRLVNAYGPTETTVCATAGVVDAVSPLSVGRSATLRCMCWIGR